MRSSLYDYTVPPGYGDTFFQYVFDASGLTDGGDLAYFPTSLIDDGDFVLRHVAGLDTVLASTGTFNLYDNTTRNMFASAAQLAGFATGFAVLPETWYPQRASIKVDLNDVSRAVAGSNGGVTFYRSQLIYSGVRRRQGWTSDPAPSVYRYYEEEYSYPFSLSIDQYAATNGVQNPPNQFTIAIQDRDFELRRIELQLQSPQQPSQFLITLYDNNWFATQSSPVLANHLCHLNPSTSSGEFSFFPSPPLLYKVNSVIRFDIYSLLFSPTTLPQVFDMTFKGVRRIPCS